MALDIVGGDLRNKNSKIDSTLAEAKAVLRTDPLKAKRLADRAFKDSQTNGYVRGQGDALSIFASVTIQTSPAAALDFASKAIESYRQIKDDQRLATTLLMVANCYEKAGWTCRSHYVLLEAFDAASRAHDGRVRASALFNLGVNAEDRKDYLTALEYYSCARYAVEEPMHDPTYWRALCAEQEMHYQLNDGLFDIQKVLEAMGSLTMSGMEKSLIESKIFLSRVARDQQQHWNAKTNLKQAYVIAKSIDDEEAMADIVCQLGENRLIDGRNKSALKLLSYSCHLAESYGLRSVELTCLKLLSTVKSRLGDVAGALESISRYAALKDGMFEYESKKHFEEMRSTHEINRIQEESRSLKQSNSELAALNSKLESALQEKRTLQKELERLVTIDELTGALNRRESLACGAEIISRFHSQNRPSVVMIVDIDYFKSINDNFGHSVGDEVLRRFTRSCQRVLRPTDKFGRLGGEEFCILLDRTSLDTALKVAERVMNSIRTCRVDDLLGDRRITASIGVAEVIRKHETIELALHDADVALYESKRSGRDKISVSGVKKKRAA